jgi:hypothetical protein
VRGELPDSGSLGPVEPRNFGVERVDVVETLVFVVVVFVLVFFFG